MSGFLIVLGILVLVGILVTRFPDATEAWFMRIMKIRRIGVAVGGVIIGVVLISSGVLILQILAGIILLYALLTVVFDPQLEGLREWLRMVPLLGRLFK